ncbi:MAG: hypothetical protein JNN01_05240 [Opitutaceae bacterium]|nr:hypothetical protein [Opitutaceae bacterium]
MNMSSQPLLCLRRWWQTVAVLAAVVATVSAETYPIGHDFEGLPASGGPLAAYAPSPTHPLNTLHALLFLAERTPTEIGAALPAERRHEGKDDAAFFTAKWALAQRKEAEIDASRDTRVFGGDVRTSPVKAWTPLQAAEARTLLALVSTAAQVEKLGLSPLAKLSLQWDLLQVWWRFERDEAADPATLLAMAKAIKALGQPRGVLEGLPSGLERLAEVGSPEARSRREPRIPVGLLTGAPSPWVEVDRESKVLFQAQRALVSARVFVRASDRTASEALVTGAIDAATRNQLVEIPRGTEVALLLGMVGVSTELEPVATSVASELRLRMAVAEDRLDPTSETSTRDGWNQWVWLFSRQAAFVARSPSPLRFVPDTTQSLFLEYGTPKHTVYFAQCALCHRTTGGGKQNPSGINVLGRYAKPLILSDPAKRLRDAEREMAPVVTRLRERIAGTALGRPLPPARVSSPRE